VIRGGEVIHRECSGFADIEWRQPIAPDTVFALASITKSFTALVVQRLIDLDTTISEYLPDYPAPGRDVTIRQLPLTPAEHRPLCRKGRLTGVQCR
jgi:CubicO group peptidase (beta-lactamase class C family)